MTTVDARLDRMESKLDGLIEAMTQLVRFEEKISTHSTAMDRFGFRVDDMEKRIEDIERVMPLVNLLLKGTGKVGLAIVTAVALAITGLVFVL